MTYCLYTLGLRQSRAPFFLTKLFSMPPKELWEAYSNRTAHLAVRPSVRPASCPVHISYIL